MRCPECNAVVKPVDALFKKRAEFTCDSCGSRLRLVGYWWVVLLPSIVVLFFPFDWFENSAVMLVALAFTITAVTLATLRLAVHIEKSEATKDTH